MLFGLFTKEFILLLHLLMLILSLSMQSLNRMDFPLIESKRKQVIQSDMRELQCISGDFINKQRAVKSQHRRIDKSPRETSHLRAFLTTMKHNDATPRAPRILNTSFQLSTHVKHSDGEGEEELKRRQSLPFITAKKRKLKVSRLNDFEEHIVSSYLNSHLRAGRPQQPKQKVKKVRRKMKRKAPMPTEHLLFNNDNTTILEAELQTLKQGQDRSLLQSQLSHKVYSIKQEPMKHYVQQRQARKRREWKANNPMQLQTFFVKLKKKAEKLHDASPQAIREKMTEDIVLPTREEVTDFIKHYTTRNKEIKLFELIRKPTFVVDQDDTFLYFGESEGNQRHGQGILIKNEYLFEGIWQRGQKVRGLQLTEIGVYTGHFRDEKKHGKGQLKWANGQFYSGEWQAGKRHGVGLWSTLKGDSYMGEWKKGVVQGEGIHRTRSGQRYEGSFRNFLKHGWGKEVFPNGDVYEGRYIQGLPQGEGRYEWQCGVVYQGSFLQGYRQGQGKLSSQKGFLFVGTFHKDRPEGECEVTYQSGEIYQGQIRQGQRNGRGILKDTAKRKVFDGYWKDDQFVNAPNT